MGCLGMCSVLVTRMGSVLVAQLPMISSLKASSLRPWLISWCHLCGSSLREFALETDVLTSSSLPNDTP